MITIRRITYQLVTVIVSAVFVAIPFTGRVHAVSSATPTAKVSFTFDDGYTSALTQAAPVLQKYGFQGTNYVITDCVGMTTAPNTCHADSDATYMTWDQISQLRTTYGWEIGSHTASHPYLATSDPTDQPLPITNDQMISEITQSKVALASHGIDAVSFAPPYGDYNMKTLAEIAKSYGSMRGFQDTGYNTWPYSEYLVRDQHIEGNVSVTTVKGYIDKAIANKQWLVLTFHDIKTTASKNASDYQYSTANLDAIAAYVKSKSVPVVTVKDAFVSSAENLLPNSSFNNGIGAVQQGQIMNPGVGDGWTTDSPDLISISKQPNMGSYPDPANALQILAGTSANSHVFSPTIPVSATSTYLLKSYLNVQQISTGEVGYYIDEYDGMGNWVSGQYKAAERSIFSENINFSYTPSSSVVTQARLQIFATKGSNIIAYVDNVQWFTLNSTTVTPPAQTNLVANGTFDAGISAGWRTDNSTAITPNSANHGSSNNPVNSVSMVATTKNAHLFSPSVAVTSSKSYTLTSYIDRVKLMSGEVGFYIDEYDASGNWISGQYKGGARNVGKGDLSFAYTPSSSSVATAQFQVILSANSGITAYFDDLRWY